ncbi:hypothetical protein LCGC14_2725400, partial [marine sediment metagenome]
MKDQQITLFATFPVEKWDENYLTVGIPSTSQDFAGGQPAILVQKEIPFSRSQQEGESGKQIVVEFKKRLEEIYVDPDEPST